MPEQEPAIQVLLVDDSPTQLMFFRNLLEQDGCQVRTATNGAEALVRLGEALPDVIVSDCDMPLLDGFQLCRLVKDDAAIRSTPILLLTGSLNHLSRFWARTCGADRFLVKGGAPGHLLEAVHAAAGTARAEVRPAEDAGDAGSDAGAWRAQRFQRAENLAGQLSQALEHRLLETTARHAVAGLGQWLADPERLAWEFLSLFEDLAAPGALYILLPLQDAHTCFLLAGASLADVQVARLLEPLGGLPMLTGPGPELRRRAIAWQPEPPRRLVCRHFRLRVPVFGVESQWGLLIDPDRYGSYANLFAEASAELEKVLQLMVMFQMLEQANRRLKQADEARTAFVLTLSHDLRSPLSSLQVALDELEQGPAGTPGDSRHLLDIGQRSVERMIRLVNGVLDLEKLEAGSFTTQPVRADAGMLALEALWSMQPLAAARQVAIAPVPERPEGFWIQVDPDRFQQILVNLLANAIKFSPAGSRIQVELSRDQGRVTVAVRDQGPGIPAAFRPRIFGKFQQAERAASGSGLGLAISKQLTEYMGGQIGFESEEGRGACFQVGFPALP